MSSSIKVPVPQYLQEHNIQTIIEEAINECYDAQAKNPVEFLSQFFNNKLKKNTISKIVGREILDSRGNPTVEVDIYCGDKLIARESAPSGASTGSNEAREFRDKDGRYMGKGVQTAVKNVKKISDAFEDFLVTDLVGFDKALQKLDGTELKEVLGGNTITASSFSVATAGAKVNNEELFLHLYKQFKGDNKIEDNKKFTLPIPCANIINGGKHAGGKLKIQEFMICPKEGILFKEGIRQIAEVYQHLKKIVVQKKGSSAKNVGDEGGFAPNFDEAEEAISTIEEAVKSAGYVIGKDIFICLDAAASEFYDKDAHKYELVEGKWVSPDDMVDFYEKLIKDHPAIISIEDPLDEKDYDTWIKLTARIGDKCQIVGDDLYTTNTNLIKQGIKNKWCNALLLKVNQIGTITEAMDAAKLIMNEKQHVMVSHRSGETATTIIADIAVAIGAKYIKTGATCRGERVSKYNRLLAIEEYLMENKMYALDEKKEEVEEEVEEEKKEEVEEEEKKEEEVEEEKKEEEVEEEEKKEEVVEEEKKEEEEEEVEEEKKEEEKVEEENVTEE